MQNRLLLVEYDAGYVDKQENFAKSFLIEEKEISPSTEKINGIPLTVFAVLTKYNVVNNNGRLYTENILKREVDKYKKNCIINGTSLMEVNHPESAQINMLNGGGIIIDCWWNGATLLGKIKLNLSKGYIDSGIVSTSGDNIAQLMHIGLKPGVSSRGLGSLKKQNNVDVVQEDYDLICWDFINWPSSKGSWVADNLEELNPHIETTVKETIQIKQDIKLTKQPLKNKLEYYLDKFK